MIGLGLWCGWNEMGHGIGEVLLAEEEENCYRYEMGGNSDVTRMSSIQEGGIG